MVAASVSHVKPFVSQMSARPSNTNITPYYSLDKLANRFYYDLRDHHKAGTSRSFVKLNAAVAYCIAWYGTEAAGRLWEKANRRLMTQYSFNELRHRYVPQNRHNDVVLRDRHGEVIEFAWDITDEARMDWTDPCQRLVEETDYDGFDYLAEFQVWEDQDTIGKQMFAELHDWHYTDTKLDEGLIGGRERVDEAVLEFIQHEQATPSIAAASPMDLRFRGQRGNHFLRPIAEKSPAEARRTMLKRALEADTATFFAIFRARPSRTNAQPRSTQQLPFTKEELFTELAASDQSIETICKGYALAAWKDEIDGHDFAEEVATWIVYTLGQSEIAMESIDTIIRNAQSMEPQPQDERLVARYHAGR